MPAASIFQTVQEIIINQLGLDEDQVSKSTRFEDLGCDSLDFVEMVTRFEQSFSLSISDTQAEGFKTVGDVVQFVTFSQVREL